MRRFVFASHHQLAFGFKNTVDFLTSHLKNTYDLSCYLEDDDRSVEELISELFEPFTEEDEIVVFTDLFGGSVNQKFLPLLKEKQTMHVIAGANLPVILTILMASEEEKLDSETIHAMIDEGRNQMIYLNDFTIGENEEDE